MTDWEVANRDALVAELEVLRVQLRSARGSRGAQGSPRADRRTPELAAAESALRRAEAALDRPSSLDDVTLGFGLTPFERSLLLLAAAPELDPSVITDLEAPGTQRPTFGMALAALPDAHWGALTPRSPLRHWRLLHLLDATTPTHSPLVVDERVLHHLLGAGYLDPDLAAVARAAPAPHDLPETLARAATGVTRAWADGHPVVLTGPQQANLVPVAAAAASAAGWALSVIDAADAPGRPPDREQFLRLLERESVLASCAWAFDATDTAEPGTLLRALADIDAPIVVLAADGVVAPPTARAVNVARVPVAERRATLLATLAEHDRAPEPTLDSAAAAVATAFDLAVPDLRRAADEAAHGADLWQACRARAGSRFDGLAHVIQPRATWADLVLPGPQLAQLNALVAAARHRTTVLHEWGFATRSARGLGTAALFAGASGTGKTLAAEVLASSLGLDLVVVDLSQVVNKYIGETEKNLRRVFEAAEDSGALLLFDEADTLFGKRTEIRDSHDRYANLEVGYLLQRIESFRGLAVLTTNAKSSLDQAFLRRLRYVVTFPYPDAAARERMWRLAFPPGTPLDDVDPARLSAIDLPGGGIAAAALTAAYLGAERGRVTAEDVSAATRWEMAKLGRSVAPR